MKKYIRTENGIYEVVDFDDECILPSPIIKMNGKLTHCSNYKECKEADISEELCDCFVIEYEDKHHIVYDEFEWAKDKALRSVKKYIIYGAIWTSTGLKYVAKMNEKGELELI